MMIIIWLKLIISKNFEEFQSHRGSRGASRARASSGSRSMTWNALDAHICRAFSQFHRGLHDSCSQAETDNDVLRAMLHDVALYLKYQFDISLYYIDLYNIKCNYRSLIWICKKDSANKCNVSNTACSITSLFHQSPSSIKVGAIYVQRDALASSLLMNVNNLMNRMSSEWAKFDTVTEQFKQFDKQFHMPSG